MTKDEALKMAIEAMEELKYSNSTEIAEIKYCKAIQSCKEALEQPAFDYNTAFSHGYEAHRVEQELEQPTQEPVAYIQASEINYIKVMKEEGIKEWRTCLGMNYEAGDVALYTHPAPSWQPNKQFVLLSLPDIEALYKQSDSISLYAFTQDVRAIEQELKRKNGFNDVNEKNNLTER